eukprot:5976804-Pyramimonas_sp.AAC.1
MLLELPAAVGLPRSRAAAPPQFAGQRPTVPRRPWTLDRPLPPCRRLCRPGDRAAPAGGASRGRRRARARRALAPRIWQKKKENWRSWSRRARH